MPSYNVHEAKSKLSQLLKKSAEGEQVIIMRNGEPVAELVPYRQRRKRPPLGFAAGQIQTTDGWEKPMPDDEVAALFGGGS